MIRTTVHTLMSVSIRLIALFFFFSALLVMLPQLLTLMQGDDHDGMVSFQLFGLSLAALLFGAAWLFGDVLARMALATAKAPSFESTLAPGELRDVGFALIGVWFAGSALLSMCRVTAGWFYAQQWDEGYAVEAWRQAMFADIATGLLQLALGVALLFGARGLSRLVGRLREHGLPPPVQETPEAASPPSSPTQRSD